MSRKKHKKQDARQNRIQVTDDAGWTHIMKGSRGQRHQRHISFPEDGMPMEALKDLTVDKILYKFYKYCKKWKESECFQAFQLNLEDDVLSSEKVNLTRCVCLGLGSLTSERASAASMYQLAFLSTTLKMLEKKFEITDVYVQDPALNSLDEEFLGSLGYTICKTPEAFGKVTETTFLFAPHLSVLSYAEALAAAYPPLCIGNEMDPLVEMLTMRENLEWAFETFTQYIDTTLSKPMPPFDRNPWPHFTRIYWPRPGDDGATGSTQPEQANSVEVRLTQQLNHLKLEEQEPEEDDVQQFWGDQTRTSA